MSEDKKHYVDWDKVTKWEDLKQILQSTYEHVVIHESHPDFEKFKPLLKDEK